MVCVCVCVCVFLFSGILLATLLDSRVVAGVRRDIPILTLRQLGKTREYFPQVLVPTTESVGRECLE